MSRTWKVVVLGAVAAGCAFAGAVSVPEIEGASVVGGVALLSGAILVLRARRRRAG
jgi:hypothetical protein